MKNKKVTAEARSAKSSGLTVTVLGELPEGSILDEQALASALKISTRTIRRMVDRRELPPGLKLGGRKVWFNDEVLAFLRSRTRL